MSGPHAYPASTALIEPAPRPNIAFEKANLITTVSPIVFDELKEYSWVT